MQPHPNQIIPQAVSILVEINVDSSLNMLREWERCPVTSEFWSVLKCRKRGKAAIEGEGPGPTTRRNKTNPKSPKEKDDVDLRNARCARARVLDA